MAAAVRARRLATAACAVLVLVATVGVPVAAESSDVANPEFGRMLDDLLPESVESVSVVIASKQSGAVFLDARELEEFAVSRLPGAQHVGFKQFDPESLAKLDRDQPIIVYCSVGYRSALITQRLEAAGYRHVRNLYGGIFEWVNQGQPVVDAQGNPTTRVHAFSPRWGVWLTRGDKIFD